MKENDYPIWKAIYKRDQKILNKGIKGTPKKEKKTNKRKKQLKNQ